MMIYYANDLSHHNGFVDGLVMKNLGHPVVIRKAGDGWFMPELDGKYKYPLTNHTDKFFLPGWQSDVKAGIPTVPYMFCRFDLDPDEDKCAQLNLDYFLTALADTGDPYQFETVLLDLEEKQENLVKAGISPAKVDRITDKIVEKFCAVFPNVDIYSGSWWTNTYLTTATLNKLATKCNYIESEYNVGLDASSHPNPLYRDEAFEAVSVPVGFRKIQIDSYDMARNSKGNLLGWQYTSDGRLPGYPGDKDFSEVWMSDLDWRMYTGFMQPGTGGGVTLPSLKEIFVKVLVGLLYLITGEEYVPSSSTKTAEAVKEVFHA